MAEFLTYEDMQANIGGYNAEHTVIYDSSNEFRLVRYFYRKNESLTVLWRETAEGKIALTSNFLNVEHEHQISFLDASDNPRFAVKTSGSSLVIGKYDQSGQFIDEIRIE